MNLTPPSYDSLVLRPPVLSPLILIRLQKRLRHPTNTSKKSKRR